MGEMDQWIGQVLKRVAKQEDVWWHRVSEQGDTSTMTNILKEVP